MAGPQGEEVKAAMAELMREVMPYVAGVFVPPDWDRRYTTAYGFELEDVFVFGMRSLETKWRMIGYPIDEMPGAGHPFDLHMPHRERADRQIKMLEAGVIGDPDTEIKATPEILEYFLDLIARSADTSAVSEPMTVQWKFNDAPSWHVCVDNDSTVAIQGEAENPDVTLRSSFEQWVKITRGDDLRKAVLRGKLRPSGSARKLMRIQKVWPAR